MLDSLSHLGTLLAFNSSDWAFLAGAVFATVVVGSALLAGSFARGR